MTVRIMILEGSAETTGAVIAARRVHDILSAEIPVRLLRPHSGKDRREPFEEDLSVSLPSRKLSNLVRYPAAVFAASRLLKRRLDPSSDTLFVNDFFYMEPVVLRLLGYRGRIVTWVRIDWRRYGLVGRMWLAAARWASDEIVAVSRFILSTLPRSADATLVYDPAPPRRTAATSSGQTFLYIGNYCDGKGQDKAIAAFHRLAADYPDAWLQFHGSDLGLERNREYRAELAGLAQDGPGAKRIAIGEFIEDTIPALEHALAALNFSDSESFSLTCLEASANGRPVIATRSGGPEEIIHDGETGFLVGVDDIAAMASRMRELLDRPDLARSMGERGAVLIAERFGEARFVAEVAKPLDLPQPNRLSAVEE